MQDVIEHFPDEHGGFYTTSLFWACSCDEWYTHPHTQATCQFCGDSRDEGAPDAHVTDVQRQATELDKHLIAQLEEALDAIGLDIYSIEHQAVLTKGTGHNMAISIDL